MLFTVHADGDQGTLPLPKIPGRQIPIKFRVDGKKFTTPLF